LPNGSLRDVFTRPKIEVPIARAVEQALIELYRFKKDKTGTLENLINSIAITNDFYKPAKIIAAQWLAGIRIS
jgi:hypothetical protein